MKIGIAFVGKDRRLAEYRVMLEKHFLANGHTVKAYDGATSPMERFDHLVFFVEAGQPWGKQYYDALETLLKGKEMARAPYGSLFMNNRFMVNKPFVKAMELLEKYGVLFHYTELIGSKSEMTAFLECANFSK